MSLKVPKTEAIATRITTRKHLRIARVAIDFDDYCRHFLSSCSRSNQRPISTVWIMRTLSRRVRHRPLLYGRRENSAIFIFPRFFPSVIFFSSPLPYRQLTSDVDKRRWNITGCAFRIIDKSNIALCRTKAIKWTRIKTSLFLSTRAKFRRKSSLDSLWGNECIFFLFAKLLTISDRFMRWNEISEYRLFHLPLVPFRNKRI